MATHPSCWFQPGPVAGLQVLLCGSPPASDPLTAGMWRISFDVPRQWCERRNWLPPPPPVVMFVFMFWLGFNICCLELWRFCFLPSFECECCPEKIRAAEEKHFIPLSNHKFWLWSNLRMQQSRIHLAPPTLGRVCVCVFLGRVEHGVKIKSQRRWQQQQQRQQQQQHQLLQQQSEKVK